MAQVDYSPVPTAEPTGPPGQSFNANVNPQNFGAGVGAATKEAGGAIEKSGQQLFETALKYKEMQNATDALNVTTAASQDLGNAETDYRKLSGNNAVAGLPVFQKRVQDIQAQYAGQLQSPMARLKFQQDFRSYADRSLMNAGIHAGDQAKSAHLNALDSAIKQEQANVVRYTMNGQEPDFSRVVNNTLMLAQEQGLDKESATALVQKTTGAAMRDAVVGRIAAGDLKGADQMFRQAMQTNAPGTDLPLLDANHQATLAQMIEQKKTMDDTRALTEQMRAMAFTEKVKREAAEKAGNAVVSQLLTDPTKVSLDQIANDPSLSFEQKWSLHNMVNASLAKDADPKDIKTYGSGFFDALKSVNSGELTDPKMLWDRAGPNGNLTVSGVKELQGILAGKGTPDGEATSKMQAGALAYAKHQLSFEADYGLGGKIPDPHGQDLFNIGFTPAFFKYWNDGLKAGKSPYELANQEEIDKLVAPIKRSAAQLAKDQIESGLEIGSGHGGGQAPIDLSTGLGIAAAFRAGKLTREQAEAEAVKRGFISPPAAPMAQ